LSSLFSSAVVLTVVLMSRCTWNKTAWHLEWKWKQAYQYWCVSTGETSFSQG
jgi:hypothetical protein